MWESKWGLCPHGNNMGGIVMAWIARTEKGILYIFHTVPDRGRNSWICIDSNYIKLPINADEKLIGRHISWEDEPVEI